MERKSNISIWQLGLFEGFDKDVMVMQRDEEEVFDEAIHVFFEKEYYDAYVSKAAKYGGHRYAYHEDKLGEVINQIFDESIPGLVFHINTNEDASRNTLCDEKYLAVKDLLGLRDAADSYHHMYRTAIDREAKEEAVARIWTKYVYIIGQLPDLRKKPAKGEKTVIELMTMKRKKDGSKATAEDFDYESLKVFLTAESAMRFNTDKKPINKYKLSLLSQFVKGKLQIAIEPHRNYWLEYDPAKLDISKYLEIPQIDEAKVKARINGYFDMDKVYILLAPPHSDYRVSLGNPFLMKMDEKNIMMYLFEEYDSAVSYVLQNPLLLPVFDGTFPIGVLDKNDKCLNLNTILAIADKLGVTGVSLDMDTMQAIICKMAFLKEASGREYDVEKLLEGENLSRVMKETDGEKQYRFPAIPFCDQANDYQIGDEQKEELIAHMDKDLDQGLAYLAGCSAAEMMVFMREAAARFDKARTDNDEEGKTFYNRLMNRVTIPLTEVLCEKPYIFTLQEENGDFTLKNQIVYLIVTNRYEAGRKGEGRLTPVGIDNPEFMDKLCEASKVAVLTDGPSLLCLMDTKLMGEVAKQWKKSETLREELMIYLTQGCNLSYNEALYYFKRLRSDSSVFVEFTSTVRNGEYPPMGMLTIEGHTARELADADGLNYLQAYDRLLSIKLKENVSKKAGAAASAGKNDQSSTEEKKGLFGKLFKK